MICGDYHPRTTNPKLERSDSLVHLEREPNRNFGTYTRTAPAARDASSPPLRKALPLDAVKQLSQSHASLR
jgi:hypothetical protein